MILHTQSPSTKRIMTAILQNIRTVIFIFGYVGNSCSTKDISVKRVYGVWRAPFRKLAQKIQVGEVALHTYQHRESDDHNAKKSYLFNLMDCKIFERLL